MPLWEIADVDWRRDRLTHAAVELGDAGPHDERQNQQLTRPHAQRPRRRTELGGGDVILTLLLPHCAAPATQQHPHERQRDAMLQRSLHGWRVFWPRAPPVGGGGLQAVGRRCAKVCGRRGLKVGKNRNDRTLLSPWHACYSHATRMLLAGLDAYGRSISKSQLLDFTAPRVHTIVAFTRWVRISSHLTATRK